MDFVYAVMGEEIVFYGHLADETEIHYSAAPGTVPLEMRPAPLGELSTGFALMGLSKTPQPVLERLTEPPPPRPHHD